MSNEDEDPFRTLWLNMEMSNSEDDDEDVYNPPNDQTDDDDDDDDQDQDVQDGNQINSPDLLANLDRFEERTHFPENQTFVIPLPLVQDLPESPFTVPQWDLLRHQCRLHFALLCRSLCFVQYCASSDSILKGIITLIHGFYQIFQSSIKTTKELNKIFQKHLFVPVLGDPVKSKIFFAEQIINHFREQKSTDDIIEAPFMKGIFESFQFNGEIRPIQFKRVSPWIPEEGELLRLAMKRFKTADDIQKYVMPGKPLNLIHEKYTELMQQQMQDPVQQPKKKGKKKDSLYNTADKNDGSENEMFVVKKGMKFAEVSCLPPSLGPQ